MRDDRPQHAVQFARALNQHLVTGRAHSAAAAPVRWPPTNCTWRGGALPPRFRHFFVPGKQFRTPMFLSTSSSRDKALEFLADRGGPDYVLWTIEFDPSRRCDHVNFIDRHDWAAFPATLMRPAPAPICTYNTPLRPPPHTPLASLTHSL